MSIYKDYINEIEQRKELGLSPKPIDDGELLAEIVIQIKDLSSEYRDCLLYTSDAADD